jgi:pimeloyl-ACP methyl ester carboxylesterase
MDSAITGTAAGVPFTALPPVDGGPAPLIVTWHMIDAPASNAAFAAALPMLDVPAWRVHLGMPMCGARMVDGGMNAIMALAQRDPLLDYLHAFVTQAVTEFPTALASLREQFPIGDGPIGVVGGSLGGAVALRVLADTSIPVFAGAVVNAAIRMRSVVGLIRPDYPYDEETTAIVDSLDFVARAASIRAPLLVVSGERDHVDLRADALKLAAEPGNELLSVPGLEHALAERPGIEPAPQSVGAAVVDRGLTEWFRLRLN